jgi:hypothetical protein
LPDTTLDAIQEAPMGPGENEPTWTRPVGPGFEEPLRMRLPPLPFPPPAGQDVVFFARRAEGPEGSGAEPGGAPARDAEDIMLRRVPTDVARRFRAAAGGRAMTHAQYLAALVELHEAARALGDAGDERVAGELRRLGLTSVTV